MADNKRVSLGNRVATPRVGNPQNSNMSTETAILRCIGARIRLTTIPPTSSTQESYIYACAASPLNILTLTPTWPPTPSPPLTILPLSTIQSFTLLSLPEPSSPIPPLIPEDPAFLALAVRQKIDSLLKAQARIGKGVSQEGQEIFDGINRTLACRWEGKTIVVIEAVAIHEPYRPEDCRAPNGKGVGFQMLGRVRKVLENERKKIAEKSSASGPVAAATSGDNPVVDSGRVEPRKGG
ncbi:hypothetical protein MMC10_010653 [Thelotrema lepadinum]|nr:hypothetical protein [Thelotrema lepadinum]